MGKEKGIKIVLEKSQSDTKENYWKHTNETDVKYIKNKMVETLYYQ